MFFIRQISAVDVIFVEQPDGSYKSSSFHVRFGGLPAGKDEEKCKIVTIEINGKILNQRMKVDQDGFCSFIPGTIPRYQDQATSVPDNTNTKDTGGGAGIGGGGSDETGIAVDEAAVISQLSSASKLVPVAGSRAVARPEDTLPPPPPPPPPLSTITNLALKSAAVRSISSLGRTTMSLIRHNSSHSVFTASSGSGSSSPVTNRARSAASWRNGSTGNLTWNGVCHLDPVDRRLQDDSSVRHQHSIVRNQQSSFRLHEPAVHPQISGVRQQNSVARQLNCVGHPQTSGGRETDPVVRQLHLSCEDMRTSLNLSPASSVNKAVFTLASKVSDSYSCSCNIHVWRQRERIIVSDVDGTITKSDIRGMILPVIGVTNWVQEGVVNLYNKVRDNGYRIIYLTARSIVQASATRVYLSSLHQQGQLLPPGPLLLNPQSALKAFKKEVIDRKPEEFKISCLQEVGSLFTCSPFHAGYGNRPTDVTAYQTVGIPRNMVFLVPCGSQEQLKDTLMQSLVTSYTSQLNTVHAIYPKLN